MKSAGVAVMDLGGEEFHFEIYDLLLLLGGWPGPVPLSVDDGRVHRLVCQIV